MSYRDQKSQIDSISTNFPVVNIVCVKKSIISIDSSLTNETIKAISDQTLSILGDKYFIEQYSNTIDTIPFIELQTFFALLDSLPKKLPIIKLPNGIEDFAQSSTSKVGLIVFYEGFYDANYDPYDRTVIDRFGKKIYLTYIHGSSSLRLILFDKNSNVLFYNLKYSNSADPRIRKIRNQLVSNILKPLYYK